MFPFEFVIFDRPLSVQADSGPKEAWVGVVKRMADLHWNSRGAATEDPVYFSIGNFYEADINQPDADNIIKPVQDALQGIVYVNDRQVVDSLGFKRQLRDGIAVSASLEEIWEALETGEEFVHVAVSLAEAPHYLGV